MKIFMREKNTRTHTHNWMPCLIAKNKGNQTKLFPKLMNMRECKVSWTIINLFAFYYFGKYCSSEAFMIALHTECVFHTMVHDTQCVLHTLYRLKCFFYERLDADWYNRITFSPFNAKWIPIEIFVVIQINSVKHIVFFYN